MTNRTPPVGSLETRRAEFAGSSVNIEKRTAEIIFTTGARVLRSNWSDGKFWEELEVSEKAVDLSRFNSGRAPLLVDHDGRSVGSVVGVIESARIAGGKGYANVRFARDAKSEEIFQKVADGVLTSISVGYRIERMEKIEAGADSIPVFLATRWEPAEASLVSMPADPGAHVRSQQSTHNDRSNTVFKKQRQQEPDSGNGSGGGDVAQKERERVEGIRHSVKTARLEASIGDELIRAGTPLDQARNQVIDILATRSDSLLGGDHGAGGADGGYRRGAITGGETSGEKFVRGAAAWLAERSGNGLIVAAHQAAKQGKLNGTARAMFKDVETDGGEFRGMSLFDLARESLERNGVRTRGMDRQKLVGVALTHRAASGDFPILLENTMHKTLQAAFALQPDTWTRFCKAMDVRDFRSANFYRSGSFGTLDTITESSEYQNKAIPDGAKIAISTATKGNIISLSRRAIIDDDMSALADLAMKLGRAARLSIESDVYALLAQNGGLGPTQTDTFPFFDSAARGNVNGTGAGLAVSAIDADRVIMSRQQDLGSNDYLDLKPAVLLVATELGGAARVINDAAYDVTGSSAFEMPNRVRGLFREVVDSPRLTGTRRYLFADPSVCPAIVVAFLEGQGQAPVIETQNGWRVDGVEWKVRIDYRAQMFDPAGAVTNAGQ